MFINKTTDEKGTLVSSSPDPITTSFSFKGGNNESTPEERGRWIGAAVTERTQLNDRWLSNCISNDKQSVNCFSLPLEWGTKAHEKWWTFISQNIECNIESDWVISFLVSFYSSRPSVVEPHRKADKRWNEWEQEAGTIYRSGKTRNSWRQSAERGTYDHKRSVKDKALRYLYLSQSNSSHSSFHSSHLHLILNYLRKSDLFQIGPHYLKKMSLTVLVEHHRWFQTICLNQIILDCLSSHQTTSYCLTSSGCLGNHMIPGCSLYYNRTSQLI